MDPESLKEVGDFLLTFIGFPLGTLSFFWVILIAIGLWEKHYVRPYSDALAQSEVEVRPRLMKLCRAARELNFVRGTFHKQRSYAVTGVFALSDDREILFEAGEGKVATKKVCQVWLFSRLVNGEILMTTDEFDEGDISGIVKVKYVVNVPLAKLVDAHRKRMEKSSATVQPFPEEEAFAAFVGIKQDMVDAMIARGWARWLDESERDAWKYTVTGTFRMSLNLFKGFLSSLPQFWRVMAPR
ncbi:MAG: hypothetical protein KDA93_14535 [Planctomycetaceae bacterium]|nr:hypothetical protein [Planctomycetaceae bacterium]